jgi:hypothetical protein
MLYGSVRRQPLSGGPGSGAPSHHSSGRSIPARRSASSTISRAWTASGVAIRVSSSLHLISQKIAERGSGRSHSLSARSSQRSALLLELVRYIVLNPVRAGMVGEPGDWPWSSYRPTVRAVAKPPWLMTDWLLSAFDSDRSIGGLRSTPP